MSFAALLRNIFNAACWENVGIDYTRPRWLVLFTHTQLNMKQKMHCLQITDYTYERVQRNDWYLIVSVYKAEFCMFVKACFRSRRIRCMNV